MLLADAITPVPRELIEGLPRLKLIHSDGAGYNAIDVAAARERGCVQLQGPHRRSPELEAELNVKYLPLYELAATCDIVSLYCAVTAETEGMVDASFIERMKRGSCLADTSAAS